MFRFPPLRPLQVSSHAPVRGHPAVGEALPLNWSFKSCPREGASKWGCFLCFGFQCFKSCPREGASLFCFV